MNDDERELALEINAMLMAFHNEDLKTLKSIVNDYKEPVDLLMGGIAVLVGMVDELLEFIQNNVDELDVDFESLIQIRGHYITEFENGSSEE